MKLGPGMQLEIVGVNAFGRYDKINNAATYNMMITEANGIRALVPQPGYVSKIIFLKGQPRGAFSSTRINSSMQVVGNKVYVTDVNLNYHIVGNLDTYTGPVFISENQGGQIAIVDGEAVYTYNYLASTFTKTVIGDFLPSYIEWLDTYTILSDSNQGEWQISESNDSTSYDPLLRAPMQTKADNLQAVVRVDRVLYAMGRKATEFWTDNPSGSTATAGGQPVSFPFTRNNSSSIDYGVISTETIQSNFRMMIWLASNGVSGPTVMAIIEGRPVELSDEGLQYFLAQLINPADSWAVMFKVNGRILYMLTFQTDNATIVYDFTEEGWYFATDQNGNHHIAKRCIFFENRLFILNSDTNNPQLLEFDTEFTTYDGQIIPRTRILPPVRDGDIQFITDRLRIPMEYGDGYNEHRVDLSLSNDGGKSFGNTVSYELLPNAYRRGRAEFFNLGMSNDLRIQCRFWTLDRFVILGADLDVRPGL